MISVILCAAGSGSRAGLAENKIFYELNGLPVLAHSLSSFAPYADELLVVCRADDFARAKTVLAPYPNARLIEGGKTRAESVFHALAVTGGDIVLVHDAARPYVTPRLIEEVIESVKRHGSGIAAIAATDTVAHAPNGMMADMPPRNDLYAVQTPQGFYTAELRAAYRKAAADGRLDTFTDDSGLFLAYGGTPHIVQGDTRNKKLTYREDFLPASRVGFGVDTHAFAFQEEYERGIARLSLSYITLGGVVIPSNRPLVAHSDGDVLVHALMDALLSAIGERDIGYHFPDTDPAYEGANSMHLLARVMEMVRSAGFTVQNASISVLAETPRLSPFIEDIRKNLRAALSCDNVAIAAGTNEKLGYVGEGKGITVYATVLLR